VIRNFLLISNEAHNKIIVLALKCDGATPGRARGPDRALCCQKEELRVCDVDYIYIPRWACGRTVTSTRILILVLNVKTPMRASNNAQRPSLDGCD
jgi:hypothetical protein